MFQSVLWCAKGKGRNKEKRKGNGKEKVVEHQGESSSLTTGCASEIYCLVATSSVWRKPKEAWNLISQIYSVWLVLPTQFYFIHFVSSYSFKFSSMAGLCPWSDDTGSQLSWLAILWSPYLFFVCSMSLLFHINFGLKMYVTPISSIYLCF